MRLPILSVFMLGTVACGGPESTGQNLDVTPDGSAETSAEVTPDVATEAGVDSLPEEVTAETTPVEVSPEVVAPGVSPVTGVDTNVNVTEPERAGGCDDSAVDTADYGISYPWGGLTAGATSFTCNSCPNGLEGLSGVWRGFGFNDDGDEDFSLGGSASGDVDRMAIDGNTFYGYTRYDGVESEFRGWFLCSQKPEHPNEHLFWVVLDATGPLYPEGAVYRTDKIFGSDNVRVISYFEDLMAPSNGSIYYCRIGARDAAGRLCNDPLTP